MKKSTFIKTIVGSFILLVGFISILFISSCQKDEQLLLENAILKSGEITNGEPVLYWGHETFTRGTGNPDVVKIKIGSEDLVHFDPGFVLHLKNGNGSTNLVSNAIVKLDGKQIFGPSDFSQKVKSLSKEITGLTENSELEVELRSTPGSYIDVWIEGTLLPGHAKIGLEGGIVMSQDGIIKLNIPQNSISSPIIISVTEANFETPNIVKGNAVGKVYVLEPSGVTFSVPVNVEMNYESGLNIIKNCENLGVLHWGIDSDKFIDIINTENNLLTKTLTFSINHFSGLQTIEFQDSWAVFNWYWNISVIKWYLEIPTPPSYLTVSNIEMALNLWQNETSSFKFERCYDKSSANIIFTEVNNITELKQWENFFHIHNITAGMACLDFWSYWFEGIVGENDHVNIILASNAFDNTNEETNLNMARSTITHEIGHALGIAHTIHLTLPLPVMTPIQSTIELWEGKLHQWDINALHEHYKPKSEGKILLYDDFNDLSKWTLWGSPSPVTIESIKGRSGIFDNKGDASYSSGAISKDKLSFSTNLTIESDVYLDYTNLAGCWSSASIGIADPTYLSWGGYNSSVFIALTAVGDACWGSPSALRRHSYVTGGYLSDSGWIYYGEMDGVNQINADLYVNKWTKLKIKIDGNGIPSFFIDDNLIFSGTVPIASSIRSNSLPLWLGDRSSGSAGKAYHDYIQVYEN